MRDGILFSLIKQAPKRTTLPADFVATRDSNPDEDQLGPVIHGHDLPVRGLEPTFYHLSPFYVASP